MRRILIVLWLLVPLVGVGYHYGPGQTGLVLDEAAAAIERAERHARSEAWAEAIAAYDEALTLLPPAKKSQRQQVRLARHKAQMNVSQLPQANRGLETLVEELARDADADPALLAQARDALANSQYYMTWLLRLEGASREEWDAFAQGARQNYRQLAEAAEKTGNAKAGDRARKDLDATIRLARMDLAELQGLPLPSQ